MLQFLNIPNLQASLTIPTVLSTKYRSSKMDFEEDFGINYKIFEESKV